MNYQDFIQPVDFSALFQLVFTLYAAFIAVEYAKSFTAQVIKRFYNFQGEIHSRIEIIKEECKEDEMLNIESDDYFKKGEGLCLVDEYQKELKECKTKATEIEEVLNNYIDANSEYRIFRHISIFMMLFSITLLLTGGIYRIYPSETMHFILTLVAFALLFVVVSWVCASLRVIQSWPEKRSLIVVGVVYIALIILSFFSLKLHFSWTENTKERFWTIGIIIAVVLPYLNFLFFFLLVTFQMRKIRKFCEQSFKPLIQQCNKTGELMIKIIHYQELKNKIDDNKKSEKVDDKNIEKDGHQ